MFWSRNYKEIDEDDGIAMLAGVVIVEAENRIEAFEKIVEMEKRWMDDSYCVGLVDGPFETAEEAKHAFVTCSPALLDDEE